MAEFSGYTSKRNFYDEDMKSQGIRDIDADCKTDDHGGIDSTVTVNGVDGGKVVLEAHTTAEGMVDSGSANQYNESGLQVGTMDLQGHTTGVFSKDKPSTIADGIRVSPTM